MTAGKNKKLQQDKENKGYKRKYNKSVLVAIGAATGTLTLYILFGRKLKLKLWRLRASNPAA